MKTLLHQALEEEVGLGLITPAEFVECCKIAEEILKLNNYVKDSNYSPLDHKRIIGEIAEHLHSKLPVTRFCNYETAREEPHWQFNRALRDIRLAEGYSHFSQLEAVIVWLSFAQVHDLPITHYITRSGRRIIRWDTGTLKYDIFPVSGVITDRYRHTDEFIFNINGSAYLPQYYAAILAHKARSFFRARVLLDDISKSNDAALEDPYFLNLKAHAYLSTVEFSNDRELGKVVELVIASQEKMPGIDGNIMLKDLASILLETPHIETIERWLIKKIDSGRFPDRRLYEFLAQIYRMRGKVSEAETLMEDLQRIEDILTRRL